MDTVKFGEPGSELVMGNLTLKYCLDWTAPRKKGCRKANLQQKSAKEIAMTGKRKRNAHKATKSQYCDFCNKFGHTAQKCTTCHAQDEEEMTGGVEI